jgi:eukaryotic-like serine/threonine-protein kinase
MSSGTRLGPYEILAPIGAGGMGEVWRARDTRLDRSVAIKVLPREFAENAQLRLRFEREARAISQLNHPNICTLHDIGRENGIDFLVMELLEGESLADRLAKGPLPLTEVLKYGVQIADALDKAHRGGIVHRDLKPGNIMITKSGAKLLDFGLARVAPPPATTFEGATEHKPLTQEGTILGTFQYMAPEQLEGEEADARTDIFAFGAVLYEMATGKRAFEGKTKTSLIAAIVQSEPPPISAIQPLTPPALEHVVKKCLAKDRDDRWQSAHDIAEELRWISEAGSNAGVAAPLIARKKSRERIAWAAALVAAIAGGWLLGRQMTRPAPAEVIRFTVPIPESAKHTNLDGSSAYAAVISRSIAPDGGSVALVSIDRDQKRTLWVHSFRSDAPRRLADLDQNTRLVWSPDSRKIAFFTGAQLKWIGVDSGAPQTICDTQAKQGTWGTAGAILLDDEGATYRVSERGGEPTLMMKRSPENFGQHSLSFLPDGRHFLFVRTDALGDPAAVYAASVDGKDVRRLFTVDRNTTAAYAAPGFVTYTTGAKLFARKFDARPITVSGEPLLLLDGIATSTDVSVSTGGAVAYQTNASPGAAQVVVVDRHGRELRSVGRPAPIWHIALSHDERSLAMEIFDAKEGTSDVWTCKIDSGVTSRLTFTPKFEWQMTWSADDTRLFFASNQTDASDIFSVPAGGGQPTLVYKGRGLQAPLEVSSDAKFLLFIDNSVAGRKMDVLALPLGGGPPLPVAATSFNELAARFSPDAKWVAYASDESGQSEIYVQQFPKPAGKIQVSNEGGSEPAWRADGREMYYVTRSLDIAAVPVDWSGREPRFGSPAPLFHLGPGLISGGGYARYRFAPAKNGEAFYITKVVAERVGSPIHVVLNATAALRETE